MVSPLRFISLLYVLALIPVLTQAQVPQEVITECTACTVQDVRAADLTSDSNPDIVSASAYDNKRSRPTFCAKVRCVRFG